MISEPEETRVPPRPLRPTRAATSRTGPIRRSEVTAGELMSSPVTAVVPQIDVLAALRVMRRTEVHHLPVVAQGECDGLVSEIDLLLALAAPPHGMLATVGEVCRRPAPRVDVAATRSTAARLMVREETDALVVVLHAELVGILTAVDLVRSLARRARPAVARQPGVSTPSHQPPARGVRREESR